MVHRVLSGILRIVKLLLYLVTYGYYRQKILKTPAFKGVKLSQTERLQYPS